MALVIGHRAAAALAAENTLEGIRAAALCKADYVELDVRLSRDGELVLMHDERVDRTTNGKGLVEDLSLEELKALLVKDLTGRSSENLRIATLKEAVRLAGDLELGLVVEMKEEGLEALVAEVLTAKKSIVTSFYHSSLRELSDISDLMTGIIISSLPINPVHLAVWAKSRAIFPKRVNARMIKEAHQKGISVYPWTVNSQEKARWLLRLGADGLVTDDPCMIRKIADLPAEATGKDNCQYYPCHHFPDQDCTHCFCPLYPCKDEELGSHVRTKKGKRFWSCINCRLVHRKDVAAYLLSHPEATTTELKRLGNST
ncbi:MAG TPA: glycerophosphodiester phosphodiesterase family protein [Methanothrix sp.]|nr:glycerophosphodiester phosphodiesterase family protein [Methanothrix sp.]